MAQIDYSGRMASVYRSGRSLPASAVAAWADAVAGHLHRDVAGVVCDLGSGTGRFSGALASRLGRRVVAVEPAAGMRTQARRQPNAAVSIVAGRAEQIPARANAFALVWMSQAIHHVADLDACARELDRTLAPGAPVILRGMFDVRRQWPLASFFPASVTIAETRFPSLGGVAAAFGRAGLRLSSHEEIIQTSAATADALVERTRLRADSTLELLSDQEFEHGLMGLADAARVGELGQPIFEALDLVVFAR